MPVQQRTALYKIGTGNSGNSGTNPTLGARVVAGLTRATAALPNAQDIHSRVVDTAGGDHGADLAGGAARVV